MSEFARTLKDLADVRGKSEYQVTQPSGLDPRFVRRLFDGEKRVFNLTIIRLTTSLAVDPKLAWAYPAQVPFILNALKGARLSGGTGRVEVRVSEPDALAALGQAEPEKTEGRSPIETDSKSIDSVSCR